jgi:hypothetical protein
MNTYIYQKQNSKNRRKKGRQYAMGSPKGDQYSNEQPGAAESEERNGEWSSGPILDVKFLNTLQTPIGVFVYLAPSLPPTVVTSIHSLANPRPLFTCLDFSSELPPTRCDAHETQETPIFDYDTAIEQHNTILGDGVSIGVMSALCSIPGNR